jgi:hypothetical protein
VASLWVEGSKAIEFQDQLLMPRQGLLVVAVNIDLRQR